MASFFADTSLVLPGDAAHLAFVTGPSRTADIELTLTRGVHGPKSVHIVLVT
jgi:L-lactate dehydrogenase complex protein LldG